jgi:hypothetical protein
MTFAVQGPRPDPTLEFDVTDASSGIPARVTILTGVAALVYQWPGMIRVHTSGPDKREPMGFFVPGTPSLTHEPTIVPELALSQVGVYEGNVNSSHMHGVGDLVAQLQPDPQRNGERSVYLSFTCVGIESMVLRYRVTLYRPRP